MDLLNTQNQWENITCSGNAQHVLNQAADGYDASIGRVVVEQSNNYDSVLIKNGTYSKVIKPSPGYVDELTINGYGTVPQNMCVVLYDNATAASGTTVDVIKITAAASAATGIIALYVPEHSLFTAGLTIALATHDADGTLTPVSAITAGVYSVFVGVAYR